MQLFVVLGTAQDLQLAAITAEEGMNSGGVVTPSREHDCRIGKSEPVPVVPLQVGNQLSDKLVALLSHHETDREASWVCGGSDKVEAAERAEGALALEVHIQDDTCETPVSFCRHLPNSEKIENLPPYRYKTIYLSASTF